MILNAAIPVGAASNMITSSGSIVPDSLRNLSVSDMGLPTPPGPLRNTRYGLIGLPSFKPMLALIPIVQVATSTTTTARGDEAELYEEVSNFHGNKPSTSVSDTPV